MTAWCFYENVAGDQDATNTTDPRKSRAPALGQEVNSPSRAFQDPSLGSPASFRGRTLNEFPGPVTLLLMMLPVQAGTLGVL